MVCDTLKWVVMNKPCFNVETGMVETLRFLRMNTIHEYNNTMGGVDLADQLRGTYRIDKGVLNRKWWWSILFWSIGVMITNAYVIYLHVNIGNGIKKYYRTMISGKPLCLHGSIQESNMKNCLPLCQQERGSHFQVQVCRHSLVVQTLAG